MLFSACISTFFLLINFSFIQHVQIHNLIFWRLTFWWPGQGAAQRQEGPGIFKFYPLRVFFFFPLWKLCGLLGDWAKWVLVSRGIKTDICHLLLDGSHDDEIGLHNVLGKEAVICTESLTRLLGDQTTWARQWATALAEPTSSSAGHNATISYIFSMTRFQNLSSRGL